MKKNKAIFLVLFIVASTLFVGCSKETDYFEPLKKSDDMSEIIRRKEFNRSFPYYENDCFERKNWEKSPPTDIS
ncbi:MAG: hypothetical protein ABIF12_00780 [bacterium]